MESYNDKVDESTRARACVFDISQSTSPSDLFLVIKLEKVLQGDINDAAEPYLKDMVSVCEAQSYRSHSAIPRVVKQKLAVHNVATFLELSTDRFESH